MERKVGEIFEYNGEWYQCVEQPKQHDCATVCELCSFNIIGNCDLDKCSGTYRSDKKSVIFKKLEKVGEPFKSMGNCYQVYKTYCEPTNVGLGSSYDGSKVVIKIKQNKENMEEKKLNFKPFDLEAAKAGKPVCTRDGRRARIICWDKKGNYPIVALIQDNENSEHIEYYTENGIFSNGGNDKNRDLMMLPQKKEGWVNVYNSLGVITFSHNPFDTKEEAMKDKGKYYVDTVKIEWEE